MAEKNSKSTAKNSMDRNIETIHGLRIEADRSRRIDQKFIDHVASFAGSTNSLYFHILFYGVCLLFTQELNTIGMIASLEAIILAVFVLINQRRMDALARRHSDLHLQTTLLVESEVTKLARVMDLVAKHLDITLPASSSLEETKQDVHPQEILTRISEQEAREPTHSTSDELKIRSKT